VTTDLFPNPWLDRRENAYRLSFADGSVSHLILFDVWHHLRYPGTALREFARVLAPGGRLILFEPAASWTGRIVYGLLHPEPLGLGLPVTWEAPAGFRPEDVDYFAAQGAASRIFWWGEGRGRLEGWRLVEATPLTSFEYLTTGGFSGPQIRWTRLRRMVRHAARVTDSLVAGCPRAFALRLLVVLEKAPIPAQTRAE
jgi:SAM-dependent methyltransferase